MSENGLKITYKIYLESDDIKQSRIISTASFMKNLFENCQNAYFKNVKIDNESDLEDFTLRLYAEHEVEEAECSAPDDAKTFIPDMVEFLDKIAQAQSYADLEGAFSIEYQGKKESYRFISESGQDFCDFSES
ncbi:MAG: hypothetical protein E7256_16320 [Lachnospiraceae bacterium]|nr:hypothetical protein [Lachnospiraceae bacterium]